MSMSFAVVGYAEADNEWLIKKAVWDVCDAARVDVPKEVLEYFDYQYPGDKPGMEIKITDAVKEFIDDESINSGYEVQLDKLPKNVKSIRFIISH